MRTEISCVFFLAHILKVGPTRAQDLCKTPIYTMYMYKRCVRAKEIFLYKFLEMGLNYVLLISFSFSFFVVWQFQKEEGIANNCQPVGLL